MNAVQRLARALAAHRLACGLFVLVPAAAAVLVACGGGGTGDSAGSGANMGGQSVSEGTLTGFGSVFVNGHEFDISSARIMDEFGNVATQDTLKLGMHVQVTGTDPSASSSTGEGTGGTVVYWSDIDGPVDAVDPTAGTVTVLGQTVDANPNTVWDTALIGGMAGLTVGEVVKVFALYDSATNEYVASRIEADPGATGYKVRGAVSNLDTTAMTYSIGSLSIDYSDVMDPPEGLADGAIVTSELQTTENGSTWMATGVQLHNDGLPGNHVTVHVRGLISSETNPAFFVLDGWPIDASAAAFPAGQAAIVPGAAVQVDGIMTNGSVVATTVNLQKAGEQLDFQVHGPITSVDQAAQTFIIRGQTVSFAGNVTYTGGSASDIVVGGKLFVQGTLSADGTSVQAVSIRISQN
jgi:hypothetical protein